MVDQLVHVAESARARIPELSLGFVVGESSTQEIRFTADRTRVPARLDYVVIRDLAVRRGGNASVVSALAQVTEVVAQSPYFAESTSEAAAREFSERGLSDTRVFCRARLIGFVDPRTKQRLVPRSAPYPGQAVYAATDSELNAYFGVPDDRCLSLGTLFTRPDVAVGIDLAGLGSHLAVLGQTRVGKSNLVGRVVEELHRHGGTILIFDPNSDFVRMRFDEQGQRRNLANRIHVYRPNGVRARHGVDKTGPVAPFVFEFARLPFDHQCALADIQPTMSRLRAAFQVALDRTQATTPRYVPRQMHAALSGMLDELRARPAKNKKSNAHAVDHDDDTPTQAEDLLHLSADDVTAVMRRVEDRLMRDESLWDMTGMDTNTIFEPQTVSVLDLGGANRRTIDALTSIVMRMIWARAQQGLSFPIFVVVEEAHNVAPRQRSGAVGDPDEYGSTYWIKRIGAEGAKLGLYLVLVSQRPNKLDEDALANCNSQIVLRLTNPRDQSAVIESSEQISQDLMKDLPGLNVGEAIAVGPIVPVPVLLKTDRRESAHGGASRDIVADLSRARAKVTGVYGSSAEHPTQAKISPFRTSESTKNPGARS
jgi:DNA helicase HerA-like ATPase